MWKKVSVMVAVAILFLVGSVWYYDRSGWVEAGLPSNLGPFISRKLDRLPQTTSQVQAANAGDAVVSPGVSRAVDGSHSLIEWVNGLGDLVQTPFIQANGVDIAPPTGSATWFGTGAVSDGLPTHFHGHTPGDFYWLFDVQVGDTLTITDDNGDQRNYTVTQKDDLNDQGYNREGDYILDRVVHIEGESINLQTCYDNDWNLVIHAVPSDELN